jgi:hypothetical protein
LNVWNNWNYWNHWNRFPEAPGREGSEGSYPGRRRLKQIFSPPLVGKIERRGHPDRTEVWIVI